MEKAKDGSWVVEAWRQRGLISGDAVLSKEDLAELHANSWFARRNKHSPHTAVAPQEGIANLPFAKDLSCTYYG